MTYRLPGAVALSLATAGTFLLGACAEPPSLDRLESSLSAAPLSADPAVSSSAFGRAVAASVRVNPRLGRSGASLAEDQADLLVARSSYVPELSVGVRQGGGGGFSLTPFIGLTQIIFDAGGGKARKRAAEARVLGGQAEQINAAAEATMEAVTAWTEVVTARKALYTTEVTVSELENILSRIEARAAGGAASETDLLTARSRIATERTAVAEARAQLARAEAVYVELFRAPPGPDMQLPPDAPTLSNGNLDHSPLLQQAEAERLAAQSELAAAKSALLPAIGAQISAEKGGSVTSGLTAEQTVTPAGPKNARIAAAEARLQARQIDLDATRRDIISRLRIISAEQASAMERAATASAATEANLANLSAASQQFDVAGRSLIELLDAQREASASERQRLVAEKDRVLLGYQALAVTGDILDLFQIRLEEPSPPARP